MTIIGTHFSETQISTALILREVSNRGYSIPAIILGETYDLVMQLPHGMQTDWDKNAYRMPQIGHLSPLDAMTQHPEVFAPARVTEEVKRIL